MNRRSRRGRPRKADPSSSRTQWMDTSIVNSLEDTFDGGVDDEEEEEDGENDGPEPGDIWGSFMDVITNCEWIAPVTNFKNAPFASSWDQFAKIGMVVEIPVDTSYPCEFKKQVHWVGKVLNFAGYKAFLEFQAGENVEPQYGWFSFCTDHPKPLHHCFKNDIDLWPLPEVRQEDRQSVITQVYNNLSTIPDLVTLDTNHVRNIFAELARKAKRFQLNEIVEAVNRDDCSQIRAGMVIERHGDRIRVRYLDTGFDDVGFWYNQHSMSQVHKLGWSRQVGLPLVGAPPNLKVGEPPPSEILMTPPGIWIREGQIFEMRHPVFTHKIVTGYVAQSLKYGYFIAGTDWSKPKECVEEVVHITSDYLLPLNFCRDHDIPLDPPECRKDPDTEFSWKMALINENWTELHLPDIERAPNPFKKGQKLEMVSATSPTYIRPATVTKVAGRLLRLHMNGLPRSEETSFEWVSCESSNIYPAGYAAMIGHPTEGVAEPPNPGDTTDPQNLRRLFARSTSSTGDSARSTSTNGCSM